MVKERSLGSIPYCLPRNLEEMKKGFVAAMSTADGDDRWFKTARLTCAVWHEKGK
jgi:hypothetical protein